VQRNGVLVEDIVAALARDGVVAHATELDSRALVTIYMQMLETDAAVRLLEATTVDVYDTPAVTGVASEALQEVADALVGLAATRDGIVVRVRAAVAEHHILLATYAELFSWVRARSDAAQLGAATATAHVYTGWLQAPLRETVESELSDAGVAFAKSDVPLAANEEPPVEIKNNRLIQPFEAVTRLYGMPGYKDLDPTLFLAGFFFLFFGLSLTDVGYGLSLVAVSAIVLLFGKVNDTIRSFMKLLLFIGSATVLVGMLFGGYFGIDIGLLPAPLQALQVFDPIGNPLPVFYLALGLGVFQVMVGLLLRIYSDARNGQFLDGLWEQGPWLFLFGVGITYVLSIVEWVAVSPELLTRLTYAGLALLVVGALRKSTGVLSALMNVFGSLYNSVGFLSDILSYSRLLALGLATTALAFAVNLIAGIVYEAVPYVGVVFAILILIIGHTFTLAVNTLGAFIHSARLQFVEFFGKFVVGTGRAFKPLARSYNHVTVTKE
jgi:V/A-type H+-transporting ATPase subunit I